MMSRRIQSLSLSFMVRSEWVQSEMHVEMKPGSLERGEGMDEGRQVYIKGKKKEGSWSSWRRKKLCQEIRRERRREREKRRGKRHEKQWEGKRDPSQSLLLSLQSLDPEINSPIESRRGVAYKRRGLHGMYPLFESHIQVVYLVWKQHIHRVSRVLSWIWLHPQQLSFNGDR